MSLPCTCSSWPTASEPLEITFQDPPRPSRFSLRPLPSSFLPSIQRRFRYFLLARAFIALVLVIRRKRRWAKDFRATLLRVLEKSKLLRGFNFKSQSLLSAFDLNYQSLEHGCFSYGDYRKKNELYKETAKQ